MDELKRGSLLFSLDACLERERALRALARAEADLHQALEHRSRIEAEKQLLEQELVRERVRAEARRNERQRLEEEARTLVNQRLEEMARAAREAKARADLELSGLKKAHEQRMTEIQLATSRSRNRVVAALASLACAVILVTFTLLYFGGARSDAEHTRTLVERARSAERARAEDAERRYASERRKNADLARENAELRRRAALGD